MYNLSDFVGTSSFNCFINRHSSTGTKSLVVVMDEVVRQQDSDFLEVLDAMRYGAMKESHVNFLLSRHLSKLSPEDKEKIKDALHIMPR